MIICEEDFKNVKLDSGTLSSVIKGSVNKGKATQYTIIASGIFLYSDTKILVVVYS